MVVMLYTFCSFLSCLGDPATLHIQIRDFDVDMQSLEELSLQELRALCEKSDIPVTSSKSQVSPVMNTFIFMFVNTFYTFQLSFPVDPFSTCFIITVTGFSLRLKVDNVKLDGFAIICCGQFEAFTPSVYIHFPQK